MRESLLTPDAVSRLPLLARDRRVAVLSLHADPSTVVGAPQNGGVTIYVRELARALANLGHDVDVITRRRSAESPQEERMCGFRVVRIDAGPACELENDAIAQYLPEASAQVEALAKQRRYDVISSHYWLSGYAGARAAAALGVPHVHTLHSHGTARRKRDDVTMQRIEIERKLLREARIVALSREHLTIFKRDYGIMPSDLAVIPGGVDVTRFYPGFKSDARMKLNLDRDALYVGYVGRLSPEKGIDELIAAFGLMHANGSRARLLVAGGAQRNSRIGELRKLAGRFGVASFVDFTGPIPNARVSDAFRASDVIAVPSHYEAFGLVALEARACGIPVVASDVGGLRELVAEDYGGARVPPSDPLAWASALTSALEKGERSRRSHLATIAGVGTYSWTHIATRILAFAGAYVHCA